jgi:hypothetical protein
VKQEAKIKGRYKGELWRRLEEIYKEGEEGGKKRGRKHRRQEEGSRLLCQNPDIGSINCHCSHAIHLIMQALACTHC